MENNNKPDAVEQLNIDGMPFRVGIKSIRDYFGEHDRSHFEHWAYSYLNKLLSQLPNPEPSVATDDASSNADH